MNIKLRKKMIAYLSGKILDIQENSITIHTDSWVWYDVFINESSYAACVWKSTAELYIYHHITEWAQSLFWLISIEEKKVFTELIKISWVGWKVALNILNLWSEKLWQAVMLEDQKTIESIKWIWKKMAEKIILELKDKDFIKLWWTTTAWKTSENNSNINALNQSQIIETLTTMWYSKDAILRAMQDIPEGMESMDDILPHIIKSI
jgi:holliday junction DNA helicase RuvA